MIGENDCCGYVDLDNTYLHVKHQASIDPTETISELSNWHIYDEIKAKGYRAVQSSLVPTNLVGHSTLAPRHHFDPDELLSIRINHKSVVDIISNNPVITKSKGCNAYTIEGKSVQN